MDCNFEERLLAAELVRKALIGYIPVREALLKFPPDTNDASVQAAFHALVHLEADEDLRNRDIDYREEQDEYLALISEILASGISPLQAAGMTNCSVFVFDGLPHGSFFHVSAGSVNMEIKERLKLLGFEALNGMVMCIVSVLLYGVIGLAA